MCIRDSTQLRSSDVPLFPDEEPAESAGTQVAKLTIRDNLRHRRDIERAYLAGIRTAREANVFVRDPVFAGELRVELAAMIESGSQPVPPEDWAHRSRLAKAVCWVAYGIVRVAMGMLRYGGDEWWRS